MDKEKALRILEKYSIPLKNCWQLQLPNCQKIFYTPGELFYQLAQVIAEQIREHYWHDVKLCILDINSLNLGIVRQLQGNLLVCPKEFECRVEMLQKCLPSKCSIICPEYLVWDWFNETINPANLLNRIEKKLKPVSYILVLSSSDETWNNALELYELHKKQNNHKQIKLVLVSDIGKSRYEASAIYHLMKKTDNLQQIKFSVLKREHIDSDCLWVIPQRKSYLMKEFPQALFYIVEEDLESLLHFRSRCSENMLMQDINKLVEAYGQDAEECKEWTDDNIPSLAPWRWELYWNWRQFCRFGIHLI